MTDTLSIGLLGTALGAIYNVGFDGLKLTGSKNITRSILMGASTAISYNFDTYSSCKIDGMLWQPALSGALYTVGNQIVPGGKSKMMNTFIEGFATQEIIYFGGDYMLAPFGVKNYRCSKGRKMIKVPVKADILQNPSGNTCPAVDIIY